MSLDCRFFLLSLGGVLHPILLYHTMSNPEWAMLRRLASGDIDYLQSDPAGSEDAGFAGTERWGRVGLHVTTACRLVLRYHWG